MSKALLTAYASGYFPMAQGRKEQEVHWYSPELRGIIPLDGFHVPRSLAKWMKHHPFHIAVDYDFSSVMRHCADARTAERQDTWINDEIIGWYEELFHAGYAHSIEVFEDKTLVGGLYGVSLGGAFFGESMFSLRSNASKLALVHLVARLRHAGYMLLDTQFVNAHLLQFGACEISKAYYLELLESALSASPNPSSLFLTESEASASSGLGNSSVTSLPE